LLDAAGSDTSKVKKYATLWIVERGPAIMTVCRLQVPSLAAGCVLKNSRLYKSTDCVWWGRLEPCRCLHGCMLAVRARVLSMCTKFNFGKAYCEAVTYAEHCGWWVVGSCLFGMLALQSAV
jgi:hypothetical protein